MKFQLTFEDHGQDFLRWIVDPDGNVLEAQPFQSDLWTQVQVVGIQAMKPGDTLSFVDPYGRLRWLKYRVAEIETII